MIAPSFVNLKTSIDYLKNKDIEFESDDIIDFTEVNPFGEP